MQARMISKIVQKTKLQYQTEKITPKLIGDAEIKQTRPDKYSVRHNIHHVELEHTYHYAESTDTMVEQ